MNDNMLVAVDDGYAETKVVREDGLMFRFPSMVRQGGILGQSNDEVHSYVTEGPDGTELVYTATGDFDTDAVTTRFEDYPFSPENRIMIHHALRRSGLGGRKVQIATSLPVGEYFNGDAVAIRTVDMKSANILKAVKSTSSGILCADIVGSKVFAEGVAAWVDFAVSDTGDFRVQLKRSAAVVDIGGNTTDTVKILKQLTVEKKNSGTFEMGVLHVYDQLAQLMTAHQGMQKAFPRLKSSAISRAMLDAVLRTGRFTENGLDLDMSAEIRLAKQTVANKILRDVEARISSGFELERLLFVGGGAAVLKDEIKAKYRSAEFVKDPEFANARGMLKAMKFS